jgi:hypothetical protein
MINRHCPPGHHDWIQTEQETCAGYVYRCRECGKREVEP